MTTPNQMDSGAASPVRSLYDHAYDRLVAKDYDRDDCWDPRAKAIACFARGNSRVTLCINQEDEMIIQCGDPNNFVTTKVTSIEQIDALV